MLSPLLLLLASWCGVGAACTAPSARAPETAARPPAPEVRELALTFDDGPVVRPYSYRSTWERLLVVDSLMNAADRAGAPVTLFTIGGQLDAPFADTLLRHWLDRGAALGNHSMTHPDFGALPLAQATREIVDAQARLAPYAAAYRRPVRYFRFPLLAEGRTPAQATALARVLAANGLVNARVTVSNNDWDYDTRYADFERAEDWAARYEVGQAYLAHIRESVALWDQAGRALTGGRPVRHVLLLHANRINRDYLGQILAGLRADGYTFVTLDRAYGDPVYAETATWTSANGVSWLEHLRQSRRTVPTP